MFLVVFGVFSVVLIVSSSFTTTVTSSTPSSSPSPSPSNDDDDVYFDKLQTRGVEKSILYI
jgi:hypothetical protein